MLRVIPRNLSHHPNGSFVSFEGIAAKCASPMECNATQFHTNQLICYRRGGMCVNSAPLFQYRKFHRIANPGSRYNSARYYSSERTAQFKPKPAPKRPPAEDIPDPLKSQDNEEEPVVEEYKHAPPPPEHPTTSNEVQLHTSSFHVPWSTWDDAKNIQNWIRFGKETSAFYWSGSKILWRRFKEARELKREIRLRQSFAQANRRELLFIRSAYKDMVKLIPYAILFCSPGGSILLPLVGWLLPVSLPSVYQTPSYQILRDVHRNQIRYNESEFIDSILKGGLMGHLPAAGKDDFIQCLNELRRVNHLFVENPESHAQSFLQHRIEILSHLSRIERLFPRDHIVLYNMLLVPHLTKFWGVETPFLGLLVGGKMRLKFLEYRFRKLKEDDQLVREFTTDAMNREELVDALYMRGFDLKGYEEFFSFERLSELMNAWLRFSERTTNPLVYLLAGPMMVFHNALPSKTSISPSVQQMHALSSGGSESNS